MDLAVARVVIAAGGGAACRHEFSSTQGSAGDLSVVRGNVRTSIAGMLDGVTQHDASRIYEVRAEYADGRVHAFGAGRTRPEAEDLLRESTRRAKATAIRYERYWIEEIDTTGFGSHRPNPSREIGTPPAPRQPRRPASGPRFESMCSTVTR